MGALDLAVPCGPDPPDAVAVAQCAEDGRSPRWPWWCPKHGAAMEQVGQGIGVVVVARWVMHQHRVAHIARVSSGWWSMVHATHSHASSALGNAGIMLWYVLLPPPFALWLQHKRMPMSTVYLIQSGKLQAYLSLRNTEETEGKGGRYYELISIATGVL